MYFSLSLSAADLRVSRGSCCQDLGAVLGNGFFYRIFEVTTRLLRGTFENRLGTVAEIALLQECRAIAVHTEKLRAPMVSMALRQLADNGIDRTIIFLLLSTDGIAIVRTSHISYRTALCVFVRGKRRRKTLLISTKNGGNSTRSRKTFWKLEGESFGRR